MLIDYRMFVNGMFLISYVRKSYVLHIVRGGTYLVFDRNNGMFTIFVIYNRTAVRY